MRILVLGVTGMLGHTVFKELSKKQNWDIWGSVRESEAPSFVSAALKSKIITGLDVLNTKELTSQIEKLKPEVVINCVGLIKQLSNSKDPLVTLPLNSMLPHQLAQICEKNKSRLIHISTDCVFSGSKGNYKESDFSDAEDLYGRSKYIGEVCENPYAITLRTSIIGHELKTSKSLVDWFLSQEKEVKGFSKAVFSGLPTVELARVIRDYVIPQPKLHGLYHVSAKAIDKFKLLQLVATVYKKDIRIIEDDQLKIDRSLNSERFQKDSGYKAPEWPELIKMMYESKGG